VNVFNHCVYKCVELHERFVNTIIYVWLHISAKSSRHM